MTKFGNVLDSICDADPNLHAPNDHPDGGAQSSGLREQIEAEINEELDHIADHNDTCSRDQIIDEFAVCQRIAERLLGTFDISLRSAVVVEHSTVDGADQEYFSAARDNEGSIRLQGGKGLVVASPGTERWRVQGWFDRSEAGRFREHCRAALAVFDAEAANSPNH